MIVTLFLTLLSADALDELGDALDELKARKSYRFEATYERDRSPLRPGLTVMYREDGLMHARKHGLEAWRSGRTVVWRVQEGPWRRMRKPSEEEPPEGTGAAGGAVFPPTDPKERQAWMRVNFLLGMTPPHEMIANARKEIGRARKQRGEGPATYLRREKPKLSESKRYRDKTTWELVVEEGKLRRLVRTVLSERVESDRESTTTRTFEIDPEAPTLEPLPAEVRELLEEK